MNHHLKDIIYLILWRSDSIKINNVYVGNNIEVLKTFPDNSIDSVVTDPPYGLGKEPNAIEVLQSWITTGYHEVKGKGFMGKEWDAFVPQPNFWKEIYRVLKPGGYVLSFAGTRTYDWMVMAVRLAGFEIRDMIAWLYGSGFPKSRNIGKDIEKINVGGIKNLKKIGVKKGIKVESGTQGFSYSKEYVPGVSMGGKQIQGEIPIYEINNEWQGWGTALKPSQETICVAQKPIKNSSVIVYNDIKEVFICLLKLYVKTVEKNFTLSHQEQSVVSNIAQWIVESNINIQADLQEAMDMLQFLSKENMNLNIVISWLNILVDLYKLRNTSTIEMVLSMTIELKILKSLEWENILQNIIQVKNNKISGTQQNVLLAEKTFSDLKMKLDYIQTHFVQENATSLGRSKNLSPDLESIVMARKPLDGTVAQNVLKHGVGGINIDECRVGDEERFLDPAKPSKGTFNASFDSDYDGKTVNGRFPANVIHDGSDEVVSLFPDTEPSSSGGISSGRNFGQNYDDGSIKKLPRTGHDDNGGSASRFFYTAKASKEERNFGLYDFGETKRKNIHPTVKPIELMRYLVRLVTPKNGICLDPYLGSGTTAIACEMEKFSWIGIELVPEYAEIAKARIGAVKDYESTLDTKTIIKESIKEDKEKELGIMNIFDFMEEE